jgi:hypothetical protein
MYSCWNDVFLILQKNLGLGRGLGYSWREKYVQGFCIELNYSTGGMPRETSNQFQTFICCNSSIIPINIKHALKMLQHKFFF